MIVLENSTDYSLDITIKNLDNKVVDLTTYSADDSYCYIVSNDNATKENMSITIIEPTKGTIKLTLNSTLVGSTNTNENVLSIDDKKVYRIVLKIKTDTDTIFSIIENVVVKG